MPSFQRQKEPKFHILEKIKRVTEKKEKRDLPEITKPDLAALYCSSEKFWSAAYNNKIHGLRGELNQAPSADQSLALSLFVASSNGWEANEGEYGWCFTATVQPQSHFCLVWGTRNMWQVSSPCWQVIDLFPLDMPVFHACSILPCAGVGKAGPGWGFRFIIIEFPLMLSEKTLVCVYQSWSLQEHSHSEGEYVCESADVCMHMSIHATNTSKHASATAHNFLELLIWREQEFYFEFVIRSLSLHLFAVLRIQEGTNNTG